MILEAMLSAESRERRRHRGRSPGILANMQDTLVQTGNSVELWFSAIFSESRLTR